MGGVASTTDSNVNKSKWQISNTLKETTYKNCAPVPAHHVQDENRLISTLNKINEEKRVNRTSVATLCSDNLQNGFDHLLKNEEQWELTIFLLTHYPGLRKFFGIDILTADNMKECPRYKHHGRMLVKELTALVHSFDQVEEWNMRVKQVITMHTKYGLTARHYETFFEKLLGFLNSHATVDIQTKEAWIVLTTEFCLLADQLCPAAAI